MAISQEAFQALPLLKQISLVSLDGLFLTIRRDGPDLVSLFHLPGGFFAEVYYNPIIYEIRTFTSWAFLEPYVTHVDLSELPL
ncbi:hypothetical protein [Hymenobacter sp. BT491]|uniref:hypothetical protein n=1 Tax=Hymenobacter sp. BT491 TaxID=2766779 RepID=UPI001653E5C0|nr:hypothetical protein [Hymenobacter sp. BT491]MBC6992210.1 hypothetical protein [Hymenobacter sp. BT491]